MDKFKSYLEQFNIAGTVTEEDIEKTTELLQLYGPVLRRASHSIDEMEAECYESSALKRRTSKFPSELSLSSAFGSLNAR